MANLPTDERRTKARMEDAARDICEYKSGASWEWINEKSLRIWDADGAPYITLHLEKLS